PRTHNKYQVEGDMRLSETLPLRSISSRSTFLVSGKVLAGDDLSLVVGNQSGRYRILFLFPLDGKDAVDIF
ncbi:hypothetical protein HY948_03540, partial [Candidatus Gottesmanbacteria bacterium]|nr:hypothetical protein [Candidatus Gottesmanbacteria bacterium]